MQTAVLAADRVAAIYHDCVAGVPSGVGVEVSGLLPQTYFDPERLDVHVATIAAMLQELPDAFKIDGGGSFLAACENQDGDLWTASHFSVAQLFALGLATHAVECRMALGTSSCFIVR